MNLRTMTDDQLLDLADAIREEGRDLTHDLTLTEDTLDRAWIRRKIREAKLELAEVRVELDRRARPAQYR